MEPNEYALLVDGELEAVVSEGDAKDAVNGAFREYRSSVITLAKEDPTGGYEELTPDEYEQLGL